MRRSHLLTGGVLYSAGSVVYGAWQQRHYAELPVTPLTEVPRHAGQHVRAQGVIGYGGLADDETVALQVVHYRSNAPAPGGRRRADSVSPTHVTVSDGKAEIHVRTAGVERGYITRFPASSESYGPDPRLIYEGERVEVIGFVDKKDPTLIRRANKPLVISNLSSTGMAAQHARGSSVELAFGIPFMVFVLSLFLLVQILVAAPDQGRRDARNLRSPQ